MDGIAIVASTGVCAFQLVSQNNGRQSGWDGLDVHVHVHVNVDVVVDVDAKLVHNSPSYPDALSTRTITPRCSKC